MWTLDHNPYWDTRKNYYFNEKYSGCFSVGDVQIGQKLYGYWWKLLLANKIRGFAWIDTFKGDFEIEIVIDDKYQSCGWGQKILIIMIEEIGSLGGKEVHAIVKKENKNKMEIINWLYKNNFIYYLRDIDGNLKQKSIELVHQICLSQNVELIKKL